MSLYLQIDLQDPQPLATISGWGDMLRWVETLPAGESEQLRLLREYGRSLRPALLRTELAAAVEKHPREKDGVADTARNLAALLDGVTDEQVALVTDGLGPDEEEP